MYLKCNIIEILQAAHIFLLDTNENKCRTNRKFRNNRMKDKRTKLFITAFICCNMSIFYSYDCCYTSYTTNALSHVSTAFLLISQEIKMMTDALCEMIGFISVPIKY